MGPSIVLAEFLPIINSCHFHINVENAENISDVLVKRSDISLEFSDSGSVLQFSLVKGIHLKPDVITGYKRTNQWISFRVQLEEKTRIVNSVLSEIQKILPESKGIVKRVENKLKHQCSSINICCKYCLAELSSTLHLEKISPVPVVNWDSTSETWFCHAHDHQLQPFKQHNLSPKMNECFYDPLAFYLNESHVMKLNGNDIQCPKCNSVVGLNYEDVLKLWSNDIEWRIDSKLIYSANHAEIFSSLLESINKDCLEANPKIVFQVDSDPKKFLFLLTMDCSLTLMTTDNSLLISSENNSLGNTPLVPLKRKLSSGIFCQSLVKIKACKVLFRRKVGADDETSDWEDDISIDILKCSETFFDSLYKQLIHSNQLVPCDISVIDNMKLGYIVKSS